MQAMTPAPVESCASPKRQAAMEAAARLFLARGYAAVSMDAVAREAGISKATLYAHFAGKDALFAAMIEARCRRLEEVAAEATGHALPPEQAVARIGRFWLDFMIAPEALAVHRIVLAEGHRFPDLVQAFYQAGPVRAKQWLSQWVAEEQRLGRIRAEFPPLEAAMHLVSLLRGEVYLRFALNMAPLPGEAEVAACVAGAARVFLAAYGVTSGLASGDSGGTV